MDDFWDDLIIYDAAIGLDEIKCPHCGTIVSKSLIFDDAVQCTGCGKTIKG